MKKQLFLAVIIMLSIQSIAAQIGLRVYNYRPTGDFGATFKPTLSAEFGYFNPFKKRARMIAVVTLLNMRPRMAEFPATGSIESGNVTTVYPGTVSYLRFILLHIHIGIDVALVKKEKFNAFIGTNLICGVSYIHYHNVIQHISDDEGIVGGVDLGLQMRVGAEYQLTEQIGLLISANRNVFLIKSDDMGGVFWANDYGLGITYNF